MNRKVHVRFGGGRLEKQVMLLAGRLPYKICSSLAALDLANAYPAIVLCPSHMTEKWAREACDVIPGVHAQVINSLADLQAFVARYRRGDNARPVGDAFSWLRCFVRALPNEVCRSKLTSESRRGDHARQKPIVVLKLDSAASGGVDMAKQLQFQSEARRSIKLGVDLLANAVKTTLGPKGRNVALDKKWGTSTVTHDGVTVAKEIREPISAHL